MKSTSCIGPHDEERSLKVESSGVLPSYYPLPVLGRVKLKISKLFFKPRSNAYRDHFRYPLTCAFKRIPRIELERSKCDIIIPR